MKEIPVTQARADLSNLVNEVVYNHERITLTRHGRPLAILISVDDARQLDLADTVAPHPLQIIDTSGAHQEFQRAAHYDQPQGPATTQQPL